MAIETRVDRALDRSLTTRIARGCRAGQGGQGAGRRSRWSPSRARVSRLVGAQAHVSFDSASFEKAWIARRSRPFVYHATDDPRAADDRDGAAPSAPPPSPPPFAASRSLVAACRSLATYVALSLYVLLVGPPGLLIAWLFKWPGLLYVLSHGGVGLGARAVGHLVRA